MNKLTRKVLNRALATPTLLGILAFLPVIFPEGTAFHETAYSVRTYGALGVLQGEGFGWLVKRLMVAFEAKGRDWNSDPRFLPCVLGGILAATILCYLPFRVFEHPGDWHLIFAAFSWTTLLTAFISSSLIGTSAVTIKMARRNMDQGRHPLIRGTEAPPPPQQWKLMLIVLGIVSFPVFCLLLQQWFGP